MRLFVAIEVPEKIKKEMAGVQQRLKGSDLDASWTKPEGIHLTLKFLGEVSQTKIPEITAALEPAAKGIGRIKLEVNGVGTFPNPKNARVIWMGIVGDIDRLTQLQSGVDEAMERIGFAREERKFTPHLTLGRVKLIRSRDGWLKAFDTVRDIKLPAFDVDAISLMKSELRPGGAVYTEMGRMELT